MEEALEAEGDDFPKSIGNGLRFGNVQGAVGNGLRLGNTQGAIGNKPRLGNMQGNKLKLGNAINLGT